MAVDPLDAHPFPVEAQAVEEDTYLVLSAASELRPSTEHPIRIHTAALEAEPAVPGSIVVRQGCPLELLAVVHDLTQDPTWREEWVSDALVRLLHETERRRIAALGLPVLGSLHGGMSTAAFLSRLDGAIANVGPISLQRLWLQVPHETEGEVFELLENLCS
ncbi:MAG: hypothetical protein O7A04_05425 [Acidobacteria bacterium]|nr:hypothetical protein [Acidobacteriota bacterium]